MLDLDRHYRSIPAPEITTSGIADVMRTPVDGVNRMRHINWPGARFTVRAAFDDGQPHHRIAVEYPSQESETGRLIQDMPIGLAEDGTPEAITTTSGRHHRAMAHLTGEQSEVLHQLIQRSIDAGEP